MSDGFAQIPPDSTGKKVDAASLDVGVNTVFRQRMIIGDNSATSQFATVTGGALVVNVTNNLNISAMPAVTGQVGLTAGTAVIGDINAISRTVQVAVGTPFTVNNISATVAVSGTVSLGAGTAVIGDLNAISRTVQVQIATPFTLNNISATTIVAGVVSLGAGTNLIGAVSLAAGTSNIGFLNNISATVVVAGVVSLGAGTNLIGAVSNAAGTALMGAVSLAAGTANIGFINNISATVVVAGVVSLGAGTNNIGFINNISAAVTTQLGPIAIMSASHGPKCVTASTSANVTLIASPGTGLSIYVTQLMVTNGSPTATRARIGTSSSLLTVVGYMNSAGGGFVMNFDPPWKLSASEAALCSVKPNASQCDFVVNFYVAA